MSEREHLRAHPLASGLTEAQLDQLAACARHVQFAAGQIIFREGGEASAFYLLLRGRVVLEQHVPGRSDVSLESLTGGDVLGLSWLFAGAHWVLDARAAEATEALALDAAGVHACMNADQALGFTVSRHIIALLYRRLEHVRLQRLDVYRAAP